MDRLWLAKEKIDEREKRLNEPIWDVVPGHPDRHLGLGKKLNVGGRDER